MLPLNFENLLQFSLEEADQSKLQKNQDFIFKYHGTLDHPGLSIFTIEKLINGYGIITTSLSELTVFANYPEIEYIELPKQLFFEKVL